MKSSEEQDQRGHPRPVAKTPRLPAAALIAAGLGLFAFNVTLLRSDGSYSGGLALMSGFCVFLGLWVVITGRVNRPELPKPPLWWTLGSVLFSLLGGAAAVHVMRLLAG